jgi:hypothetical protein
MIRTRFRLVRVGDPAEPVRVLPLLEEEDRTVWLLEGSFSEPLRVRSLEAATLADLPEWLLTQNLPLELLPVQESNADTDADALLGVYRAAEAAARMLVGAAKTAA